MRQTPARWVPLPSVLLKEAFYRSNTGVGGGALSKKRDEKKRKGRVEWVLRCPICLSARNDLWLGGKGGLQTRKCLDCGYVGSAFIEVQAEWSPKTRE